MNILIVHYNTPELTRALIHSIQKHTPGCHIYIFDNSDSRPFVYRVDGVSVIKNTNRQIIDWKKWLKQFPNKYPKVGNNYGSAKHCYTVQLCFDLIPDGFILVDSDVLIKQDISCLWNKDYIASGMIINDKHIISIPRLAPYLCYINVPMCREHGISYFNETHMWKLVNYNPNRFYDTGAWFLQDIERKKLPLNKVNIHDYMVHLSNGSWKNKNYTQWLNQHKDLWKS